MSGKGATVLFIWRPEPELRDYLANGLKEISGGEAYLPAGYGRGDVA